MGDKPNRRVTRRQTLVRTAHGLLASTAWSAACGGEGKEGLDFRVQLEVITEGYDRKSDWFQPRIGKGCHIFKYQLLRPYTNQRGGRAVTTDARFNPPTGRADEGLSMASSYTCAQREVKRRLTRGCV
ncbi:MAG TPA: hypothetical protein VNE39_09300 [Planctomycetota bacterium]|nr:hypothetical protein [Planctomycetota bacterium]